MKSKNQVYVKVDSKKVAKKLKKVLDMFGEKVCSEYSITEALEKGWVIHYSYFGWEASRIIVALSEQVTVSELKQILFREHAKKGDFVVFKGFNKSIAEISHIEGDKVYVKNELFIETGNRYSDGHECVSNFIRYATEEEKELLNPAKELEVGKWYKHEAGGIHFISSENENYGIDANGLYYTNRHEPYMPEPKYWKEATKKEVQQALIREAEKRYGNDWKTVKINEHADGGKWIGLGLGLNEGSFVSGYYTLTNNLYSNNGVIFHNGKWAEKLEELPKINALDVAVVESIVEDARQLADKLRKLL